MWQGNHDLAPINMYPVLDPSKNAWYLNPVGEAFKFTFSNSQEGDAALALFKKLGYYTVPISPGFRLVFINTQFQNPLNFWLVSTPDTDPGQQLAWLEDVLGKAQNAGEKVLILGHIPPGIDTSDSMETSTGDYNAGLVKIVDRFNATIVGQFYGHTHTDHFKIFKDAATNTKPTGVAYVSPAITQWENHNPGFRLVQYNKKTFELENFFTFTTNLTTDNLAGAVSWNVEYDAIGGYGISDMSPNSWNNLLVNQLNTVESMWNKFAQRFTAGFDRSVCSFKQKCKVMKICAMGNILYDGYGKCIAQDGKM